MLLFIVSGIGFFLIFLILPFYLYWLIKSEKEYEEKEKKRAEELLKRENQLYYGRMAGAGTITCNDCGYNEGIIAFLHGHEEEPVWTEEGYQYFRKHSRMKKH